MGNNVDLTKNQKVMNAIAKNQKLFFQHKRLHHVSSIKFPLSTQGAAIVDAKGNRVKLAGTNWSGGHMARHCVDGLECRPISDIIKDLRDVFHLNCVRLTYSLQMFYDDNPIPVKYLTANPQMHNKTAMEIFDMTITELTKAGLMVILNNHTSKSQWCCSNSDGDGLWWSRQYPEYMFFESSEELAKRYGNNERVVGMDLRNQLREAHKETQKWGQGHPRNDWKRAAEICANRVHKICPHWLVFVSGLNYQTDLTRVAQSPLQLKVPNKLIYTGHFYSWSWTVPNWNLFSYQNFKKKFFNTQTFVRALGVPYFLGEFGNNKRDVPWNYLIRYLKENDIDWTYWCCDGFKGVRSDDETYGLFTNDFKHVRNNDLYQDILTISCKNQKQ